MFDENQTVQVRWASSNMKYYINQGIVFTKIGDTFEIPAKLLSSKSSAQVKVICDYCGKEYYTKYATYNKSNERGKVACKNCKQKKREDSFISKYGVNSPGASKFCKEKAIQSMIDKYGQGYALQTLTGRKSFEQSMLKKYNCVNPALSSELAYKARVTAYNNGTFVTSIPEQKIIKMLIDLYGKENCYPGYPVDKVNLDCLLTIDNVKIDVEYDGYYWHKDTKLYDQHRNHWLIANGYKVIRVLGNTRDDLPSCERLKEEVDYILAGHNLGYIDMNN